MKYDISLPSKIVTDDGREGFQLPYEFSMAAEEIRRNGNTSIDFGGQDELEALQGRFERSAETQIIVEWASGKNLRVLAVSHSAQRTERSSKVCTVKTQQPVRGSCYIYRESSAASERDGL